MKDNLTALIKGLHTDSPEATEAAARALALAMPPNATLALYGDLGAGKSTFVRGLARAWGITQPITSPTYNLLNVYQGDRQLLHLDAYRLDNPHDAESLLIEDLQREPWALAIEWPEKVPAYWLENAWRITLSIDGPGRHMQLVAPA